MSLKVIPLREDTYEEWVHNYETLGYKHAYSSPYYIKFLSEQFQDPAELVTYSSGDQFIYYPYFKRRISELSDDVSMGDTNKGNYDVYSSWYYGGPLAKSGNSDGEKFGDFDKEITRYFCESGCVSEFIRFDANEKNDRLRSENFTTVNRETVYINLQDRSYLEIEADFKNANRRAIRKAESNHIEVREIDSGDNESWEKFALIYRAEMLRKDAPDRLSFDATFFQSLKERCGSDVTLLVAYYGQELIGGFIIIRDSCTAYHFLSASHISGWEMRVNNLLFARAVKWAWEKGLKRFDFMGGRPGVMRFKSTFSQTRAEFKTFCRIYDASLYASLVEAIPDAPYDNFPEYRKP